MPDILQTVDHYKHSRKWTLTGRWGEECVACLVFLLDSSHTPITKKKSLLGEINHLLRTSDDLGDMLQDCELSKSLARILVSCIVQTQDDSGIDCLLLLEQRITCTVHPHSKRILEDVTRKFYEHSNNPRVASYLTTILSTLISENLELRNEVINNKLIDNMCDSLRPSNEHLQNVIISFLLRLHSYSPLSQVVSELRLLKLIHNTVALLECTTTVAKAVSLLHALFCNDTIAARHKKNLINQGKLMQGLKHGLAYTKSSEVISSALSLLKILDAPQLIAQYNLLDYILECLSSEDEAVCLSALDLCISSHHSNKSSVMYISDSLISLIDREKKRMRGDIIERCLVFLLKLSEMRLPEHFHSTIISIISWADETIVSLLCLVMDKFKTTFTPVQAMSLLVEMIKWMNDNLSQRARRLPTSSWLGKVHCPEGEQVLGVVLNGMGLLMGQILDQMDKLDNSVLKDIVVVCDEHCIPAVFSLDTSELCPHVYKHLFAMVTRVLITCHHVHGSAALLSGEDTYAAKFVRKIFGLSRDIFILRSTLCSAFKHPDVLSVLHSFIASVLVLNTATLICDVTKPLYDVIMVGLEVLPFCELEEALADSVRNAERPSYHTELVTQSCFCANVTCMVVVLAKLPSKEDKATLPGLASLLQIVNLYGTHRLLPSFFLSLAVKLFSLIPNSSDQQLMGLKLALDTQESGENVEYGGWDTKMLLFTLSLSDLNSSMKLKCGLRFLGTLKDGKMTNVDSSTSVNLLQLLVESNKISEHLGAIHCLISKCTDSSVLESLVVKLNTSVMLDATNYSTTLNILTSIATCHPIQPNPRSLMAVLQCMLCGSSNSAVSLQHLYVQYVLNPGYMAEMLASRYDVVATLCSYLKYSSSILSSALLLILEHLNANPSCEGVLMEVSDVAEIIQRSTDTLTLVLIWKLLTRGILSSHTDGLCYLALQSIVEPDHLSSLSAALFVSGSCDISHKPWFSIAFETSILLDDLPSGILWLLGNQELSDLRKTVTQLRLPHVLACLVRQFHTDQMVVVMRLLGKLHEVYPAEVAHIIRKCAGVREKSAHVWVRGGKVIYHESSIAVLSETQETAIRLNYSKLYECVSMSQ